VQNRDDWLMPPGALFGKDGIEAFARRTEPPEWIRANGGRPIYPCDYPPRAGDIWAIAECNFCKIGQPVVLEFSPPIIESLGRNAEALELRREVLLADRSKVPRLERAALLATRARGGKLR
jgi:hypothetical protein